MSRQPGEFSPWRLLAVLVPVLLIGAAVWQFAANGLEQATLDELNSQMIRQLLPAPTSPRTPIEFVDSDGDLLADPPAEALSPAKLVFSYIAPPKSDGAAADWADLTAALADACGVPCEYKSYATPKKQLTAFASGELQVCGFNTGGVPTAVRTAGFVPVCTFGRGDGSFGYTMRIIAPAQGGVAGLAALGGGRVTFVQPTSNSGCKAALLLLRDKHDLLPGHDYEWAFSLDHGASIRGVAAGEIDAAPVASDILDRMIAAGEIKADAIKVLYESETFPPAALGYAYNLAPELKQKIRETLIAFPWAGSSIEGKVGGAEAEKFVPVDFKNDWANVRRVDDAVRVARQQ